MISFRYSGLSAYYQCPKLYEYQCVLGLRSDPTIDMEFGTAIHLIPEACFAGESPTATFLMKWEQAKELTERRHSWEELRSQGEVFASRFERLHAKHYEPLFVEKKISTQIGEFEITGTPDFIGKYKGELCVVDFKTSAYEYPKAKLDLNEQMYIYAYMAKKVYNLDIKALYYVVFIKNPEPRIQVIRTELTQDKLNDMMLNTVMVMRDIAAKKEFYKNRNSCILGKDYKCSFYNKCYGDKNE